MNNCIIHLLILLLLLLILSLFVQSPLLFQGSPLEHPLEETLLIIALAVVSVITFFANLLVIAAFCIDKRLRKTNNYFVVSLTIVGMCLLFDYF